jgi:hypothetical protein
MPLPNEMPPEWVSQITQAVKESKGPWWQRFLLHPLTALVVGALLAFGASTWQDHLKAKVAIHDKIEEEKHSSYLLLSKDFTAFQIDLESAVTTFEYAITIKNDRSFSKNVRAAIDLLSDQMAQLRKSAADPRIDPSLNKEIHGVLNKIGSLLADAQRHPENVGPIVDLYRNQNLSHDVGKLSKNIEEHGRPTAP